MQAYAVERAIISAARPSRNGADLQQFLESKGKLLKPFKGQRKRPPQHLRLPSDAKVSI